MIYKCLFACIILIGCMHATQEQKIKKAQTLKERQQDIKNFFALFPQLPKDLQETILKYVSVKDLVYISQTLSRIKCADTAEIQRLNAILNAKEMARRRVAKLLGYTVEELRNDHMTEENKDDRQVFIQNTFKEFKKNIEFDRFNWLLGLDALACTTSFSNAHTLFTAAEFANLYTNALPCVQQLRRTLSFAPYRAEPLDSTMQLTLEKNPMSMITASYIAVNSPVILRGNMLRRTIHRTLTLAQEKDGNFIAIRFKNEQEGSSITKQEVLPPFFTDYGIKLDDQSELIVGIPLKYKQLKSQPRYTAVEKKAIIDFVIAYAKNNKIKSIKALSTAQVLCNEIKDIDKSGEKLLKSKGFKRPSSWKNIFSKSSEPSYYSLKIKQEE